jgi:hypothetical protein
VEEVSFMTDEAYNDGSNVELEVEPEDAGDDGDMVIETMTDDEVAAGEFLGAAIDVADDSDDGSQWGTIENPTMRPEDF